jgi:hypothetical protein
MKWIIIPLLCLGSFAVSFGGTVQGTTKNIQVESTGSTSGVIGLVEIVGGTYTGSGPSCTSTPNTRFAFDPSTNFGKAVLSILLTADASGKPVKIYGSGNCDPITNYEIIALARLAE